jgi:hypothetical protein
MADKLKELYIAQIKAKMEQINPRLTYINNPKSIDQIKKHTDAIFLIIDQIKDIIKAYPSITMEPTPEDLYSMIEKTRDIKASNFAIANADLNIQKAKVIGSERKRIQLIDDAKMLIIDAKNIVRNQELLAKLDAKMTELGSL